MYLKVKSIKIQSIKWQQFFRKIPQLRFCIVKFKGEFWFKLIDNFKMDFEVIDAKDPMDIFEELTAAQYDMTKGPLWKARIVESKNGVSVFHFAFQHVIGDGVT